MKYTPFRGQEYSKIHSQCASTGKLFEDPEFPPTGKSLYFSQDAPDDIEWKRPGEIVDNPQLFVDGASANDFAQGELGNCWFVAACSCIAQEPQLVKRIVPDTKSQEWDPVNKYTGAFHFHFFHFGVWLDVVIDDLLPTRDNRLVYVHSKTPNEFWSALLEKAYAKLFGDYESLEAGKARDALVDMMGGIGEGVELEDYRKDAEKKKELFKKMEEGCENHSLMSASIATESEAEMESKLSNGLVKGHAYGITDVRAVKIGSGIIAFFKSEKIQMVRLRNPWGCSEWTGPWSDGSLEWGKISENEKKEMGLVFTDDGEFWMSFEDFCHNFSRMDICHMYNTSMFSFNKTWKENVCFGTWYKETSGGCTNYKDTFLNNPQFLFDILGDEDDVTIYLEQEDARIHRKFGKGNESIGFAICKADLNRECRMHDYWENVESGPYVNSRSVFNRLTLKKGRYLLVPSSFDPGHVGRFLIRMYCGTNANLRSVTYDHPEMGGCCGAKYKSATQVHVIKAEELEKQDKVGGADPYCIIMCEGNQVKTPMCKATLNPEWDWRVTFYRKKPTTDVIIEIWNYNKVRDEFMGVVRISGASTEATKEEIQEEPLFGIGKEAMVNKPGTLTFEIKQFAQIEQA